MDLNNANDNALYFDLKRHFK